ncbi:MAG: hypothetical protein JWO56_1232 [Acidobacteria bacterium]|nr:hypothetical protein [Acidobacteriota bacterium]
MTVPAETAAYWRELAEERGRRLEEIRALLLSAIDTIPDQHVRAFVTALDASRSSWLRELDSMTTAVELEPADVLSVLDDLWRQAGGDSGG